MVGEETAFSKKYQMVDRLKKSGWSGDGSSERPLEPFGGSVRSQIAVEVARLGDKIQVPINFIFTDHTYKYDPSLRRFDAAEKEMESVEFVIQSLNADIVDVKTEKTRNGFDLLAKLLRLGSDRSKTKII